MLAFVTPLMKHVYRPATETEIVLPAGPSAGIIATMLGAGWQFLIHRTVMLRKLPGSEANVTAMVFRPIILTAFTTLATSGLKSLGPTTSVPLRRIVALLTRSEPSGL